MSEEALTELTGTFAAFLLVFFRTTGLVIAAPLLASQSFPMTLRVWVAFALALIVFPVVRQTVEPGYFIALFRTPVTSVIAVFSELSLGWVVGFSAATVLYGIQVAGHLVGQEIGLSIGEVFDPVSQSVGSPTSNLFYTVGVLVFVVLGGHDMVFEAMVQTFKIAPAGSMTVPGADTQIFVVRDLAGGMWTRGVTLALPMILALLIATVGMAIMARAVPEMNIFIIGFAIRIGLGLFAFWAIVPFIVEFMHSSTEAVGEVLGQLLPRLRGG